MAVRIREPNPSVPTWPQDFTRDILREIDRVFSRVTRYLTAAESSTSTTPALVTDAKGDWAFPVVVGGIYRVRLEANYQTAATTTGGRLNITAVGAAGIVTGLAYGGLSSGAAATGLSQPIAALPFTFVTTGVSAINTPHALSAEFTFICETAGSLEIRWGSEVGGSAAQLNAGSILTWEKL